MKKKIEKILYLAGAFLIVVILSLLVRNDGTIDVDLPMLKKEDVTAQEETQQKIAQEAANRARNRRIFSCSTDDDCVIVDRDLCGCLVGPNGVVAINVSYISDFNNEQDNVVAKACPEVAPSVEKECSPSARAVCQARTCKIVY